MLKKTQLKSHSNLYNYNLSKEDWINNNNLNNVNSNILNPNSYERMLIKK